MVVLKPLAGLSGGRENKKYCTDNPTYHSVDRDTQAVVQGIIDRHFASHTVLSVMHRLEHVRSYDKVALLNAEEPVEFDSPAILLARASSRFAALYLCCFEPTIVTNST